MKTVTIERWDWQFRRVLTGSTAEAMRYFLVFEAGLPETAIDKIKVERDIDNRNAIVVTGEDWIIDALRKVAE